MKEKMKKLVALLMVMSLAIGVAQLTQGTTAEAAGKYKLKVAKNVTVQVSEEKDVKIKTSKKYTYSESSKVGDVLGYGVGYKKGDAKFKVVSGKDKVSVVSSLVEYGTTEPRMTILGKKAGTAKIKITLKYYKLICSGYEKNDGLSKLGKKLKTVTKTIKVTVKPASPISKSKLKIADKDVKLSLDEDGDYDSEYEFDFGEAVYNKKNTEYAVPATFDYKVVSGGECIKVSREKDAYGEEYLDAKAVSAGTAELEVTVTWKKYRQASSGKDKLLDKAYATTTFKTTITVTE
jgi:hypothetical protein